MNLYDLGQAIKEKRRALDMTQTQLAVHPAVRLTKTTISDLENGVITDIGIRKVLRILEFLNMDLHIEKEVIPPTMTNLRNKNRSRQTHGQHFDRTIDDIDDYLDEDPEIDSPNI